MLRVVGASWSLAGAGPALVSPHRSPRFSLTDLPGLGLALGGNPHRTLPSPLSFGLSIGRPLSLLGSSRRQDRACLV